MRKNMHGKPNKIYNKERGGGTGRGQKEGNKSRMWDTQHIQDTHTGVGTRQTEHVLPGVSLWPRGFRKSQIDPKTGRGRPATQTDSQTEGFTYVRICLCVRLCVCVFTQTCERVVWRLLVGLWHCLLAGCGTGAILLPLDMGPIFLSAAAKATQRH